MILFVIITRLTYLYACLKEVSTLNTEFLIWIQIYLTGRRLVYDVASYYFSTR